MQEVIFKIIYFLKAGSIPYDELLRNLLRHISLSKIYTGIDCLWILVRLLPEGILYDARGVMFIVHHIFIQSVLQAADRNYIYSILPFVRVVSNPN